MSGFEFDKLLLKKWKILYNKAFINIDNAFFSAPTQMLEPATLPGIVSCVLSVLCGGLNLLRGVHAIESILQVRTRLNTHWGHITPGLENYRTTVFSGV